MECNTTISEHNEGCKEPHKYTKKEWFKLTKHQIKSAPNTSTLKGLSNNIKDHAENLTNSEINLLKEMVESRIELIVLKA